MRITTIQSQQSSGTSLQCKIVAAIFGGKLFGGSVFCWPVLPMWAHHAKH